MTDPGTGPPAPPGTRARGLVWPGPMTAVAGVIGYPVRHSLSPRLHNAAYAAMGLDWCYLAFDTPPGAAEKAIAGAAALGLRGLSVTMPHKEVAARLAARHSRQVRRLGVANTLVFDDGVARAENCDGQGLLDDLRAAERFDPEGRRCGVIGAGGAARATLLALAEAGAAEIVVVNRSSVRAWKAVALAPRIAHVGRPEELRNLDLVVQATPSQMAAPGAGAGGGASPMSPPVGAQAPSSQDLMSQPTEPVSSSQTSALGVPLLSSGVTTALAEAADAAMTPSRTGQPDDRSSSGPRLPAGEGDPDAACSAATVLGVDPSWFGPGQLVVDLVYNPLETPFLIEASRSGARVRGGLGMLVHQAARQFRMWTGQEAPLAVMWAAVLPEASGAASPPRPASPLAGSNS